MQHYELPAKIRAAMAQDEPAVKSALAQIANAAFGRGGMPQGIYKYEGGIVVNGREIAIKDKIITDDWHRAAAPTDEEAATARAIEQVAELIRKNGVASLRARYGACTHGDPLRALTNRR